MWTYLSLLLYVGTVISDMDVDKITSLPGLQDRINFQQYSGYLKAFESKRLFYWFVESQGDPMSDPLVIWLNGGPGCSSILGFLDENGPFRIGTDGKSVGLNPYSWNRIANMLYIEAPAGVGFSYATDYYYVIDDDQTAADNFAALQDFYERFPKFANHDLYITGESYAGVYVPTLAVLVADDPTFKFKGFAVGNAITDWDMLDDALMYFAFSHGLVGQVLWGEVLKQCCKNQNKFHCKFHEIGRRNSVCHNLISEIHHIVDEIGLNRYNLFAKCDGGVPDSEGILTNLASGHRNKPVTYVAHPSPLSHNSLSTHKMKKRLQELPEEEVAMALPCTNSTHVETYLNSPDVRAEIHVNPEARPWGTCSSLVSATYNGTYRTLKKQYLRILEKGHRIMVYNGDADMACNFLGDQQFVNSLNRKEVQRFKEWYYTADDGSDEVAGFVHQFLNIDFVTVKGAGHMVPTDKPKEAFIMFAKFLANQPF